MIAFILLYAVFSFLFLTEKKHAYICAPAVHYGISNGTSQLQSVKPCSASNRAMLATRAFLKLARLRAKARDWLMGSVLSSYSKDAERDTAHLAKSRSLDKFLFTDR